MTEEKPEQQENPREKRGSRNRRQTGIRKEKEFDSEAWKPKTQMGKSVKAGTIKHIDELINQGKPILEAEIVDHLVPGLESTLLAIGQSKGKFGGGKGSIWRQTQKKTPEGNKPSFATLSVVGNKNGYVGIGFGKGKETVPAREKATRRAKLSFIKIRRGCGSWQCNCGSPHSIPYKIVGKCGSAEIVLMPAPRGTGLVIQEDCKKIIELAGIKDVHSKTFGDTRNSTGISCLQPLNSKTFIACVASLGMVINPSASAPLVSAVKFLGPKY